MSFDDDRREPTRPRRTPAASGQQALEELLQAAPGLARIAASMARQGASDIANAYVEGASRVVRAASQGESTADAVQETTAELRAYLRELIGVDESTRSRTQGDSSAEALRSRGEELLRRSADVSADVDSHPAYMRILDALAPDEARILRFLAREGEQPSVDVRAGLPFASTLIAQGCTMIAEEAGCRHADRVYAYLNNLNRLPGARGAGGGYRGAGARRTHGPHRPPQHRPHPVRRGLLRDLPTARLGRRIRRRLNHLPPNPGANGSVNPAAGPPAPTVRSCARSRRASPRRCRRRCG
jgi:hypothetical protein